MQLDKLCSMSPALRRLRRETHFVKPDGESLMQAINRMDGEEIKLVSRNGVLMSGAAPPRGVSR